MKYNRALRRRFTSNNTIDPILLKDIDDSNEWLLGRMEDDDGVNDDDFVFEDDSLTWSTVSRAAGVLEPFHHTRSSSSTNIREKGSSSRGAHTLVDEDDTLDEEEEDINVGVSDEEEDEDLIDDDF